MVRVNGATIVLAVVCLSSLSTADDPKDAVKKAMAEMVKECQKKTGASNADLDMLRARKLPETKEGICMFSCFFENANVFQDGKYSPEGLITALTPLMGGDESKIANLKKMAETCASEVGSGDKCEMGQKLMHCTVEKGKEFGFEYPNEF